MGEKGDVESKWTLLDMETARIFAQNFLHELAHRITNADE